MKRPEKSGLGRFATESAVIVGSILLAFAIDAWWSDRIDRRALIEQLDSVEAELVTNLEATESRMDFLGQRILLTNQVLLALSDDEVEMSQGTFMSNLGKALIFGRSIRNRHNAIEALKSSSQFSSYENVEFVKALNDFTGTVRDVENIEEQRTALYYSDVKPTLERNVVMVDLGWTELEYEYDENRLGVTPRPGFTNNMDGIRSLDTWNTIFGWKIMLLDYQEGLGRYKKSSEELIGKVRAELERLR